MSARYFKSAMMIDSYRLSNYKLTTPLRIVFRKTIISDVGCDGTITGNKGKLVWRKHVSNS